MRNTISTWIKCTIFFIKGRVVHVFGRFELFYINEYVLFTLFLQRRLL